MRKMSSYLVRELKCKACRQPLDRGYTILQGILCDSCGVVNPSKQVRECIHLERSDECLKCLLEALKPDDYIIYPEDFE